MGILYVGARDEKYRPVVVLTLEDIDIGPLKNQGTLKAFLFFFKVIKEFMLLPYFVEHFTPILDLAFQDLTPHVEVLF